VHEQSVLPLQVGFFPFLSLFVIVVFPISLFLLYFQVVRLVHSRSRRLPFATLYKAANELHRKEALLASRPGYLALGLGKQPDSWWWWWWWLMALLEYAAKYTYHEGGASKAC
jgi:hypothetical protein